MEVVQFKKESTTANCVVKIPAVVLSESVESRLREYGQSVAIAGFRKGKIPQSVLQKRFGKNAFGEAVNEGIKTALEKIISDNSLRVAMQPDIDLKSAEKDKDLEFSISFTLLPDIALMDFSQLKVEKIICKVSEADITKYIKEIAKSFRETKSVKRTSKKGDLVVVDFIGKVDSVAFEGGQMSDYALELGSRSFIDGFEQQLEGKNKGDKVKVTVTFPKQYHTKSLAGREAVFDCDIKDVKVFDEVAIDDAFAKKVGVESLQALRENVKQRLAGQYDPQTRNIVKKSIMDQLDAQHTFDVPEQMVNKEFEELWQQIKTAKETGKLDAEDAKKSDSALEKSYRTLAKRRIKLGLLITEIAKDLQVEVKAEDIQSAIMGEAQRYPNQQTQIIEYYKKNPAVVERLKAPLLEEKTIDALLKKATVKNREMTSQDIAKMLAEEVKDPVKKGQKKA